MELRDKKIQRKRNGNNFGTTNQKGQADNEEKETKEREASNKKTRNNLKKQIQEHKVWGKMGKLRSKP